MDNLPDLPFEQVLSHLSLKQVIKSRAVCRSWCNKINSLSRMKSLCFSGCPIDFIFGKRRVVTSEFTQNFISSHRFASFVDTFGQTILSEVKHLRLYALFLEKPAAFVSSLNSFGQLQELDIIRLGFLFGGSDLKAIKLNLPVLQSILIENTGIKKLTLKAPKLKRLKLSHCPDLEVNLVHVESVERLLIDRLEYTPVRNLRNLMYLHCSVYQLIDPTLLSSLKQLKEIHLGHWEKISELFVQKQRAGLVELKVYLCGLLLSGPDDPLISSLLLFSDKTLRCLAKNASRMADEIPLQSYLLYRDIEQAALGAEINILNGLTDLKAINLNRPVQDVQLFLVFLKTFENIVELNFSCDQPQDLFDRLPEHSAIQKLTINGQTSDLDFRFLLRLNSLLYLGLFCSIDRETIRNVLEELHFLSNVLFHYKKKAITVSSVANKRPRRFSVWINQKIVYADDVDAVMQLLLEDEPQKKGRKRRRN